MLPMCFDRRSVILGFGSLATGLWSGAVLGAARKEASVSVRAYGARGIGSSFDDSGAIQSAIDQVWQSGGGYVVFPATEDFYNIKRTIICRPGVSLVGDGNFPRLVAASPHRQLLLPGNFHPHFISRARYDALRNFGAGSRSVRLESAAVASRYPPGTQVYVASRTWGETGGYGLPHYGWLNIVMARDGDRIELREPLDLAIPAEITPLRETMGRNNIPLFFHADACISGLSLEAAGPLMNDSAMLRVDWIGNRQIGRHGIYGNAFQYVRWIGNDVTFFRTAGEQSLTSLNTVAYDNRFVFHALPGDTDGAVAGFYFQEFGRNLQLSRSTIDLGPLRSRNFLISIAKARDILVDGLVFTGMEAAGLIYMGNAGESDFPIVGNAVRDCHFVIPKVMRYAMVQGFGSPNMRDNIIEGCDFQGNARAPDAFRFTALKGRFLFRNNKWQTGRPVKLEASPGLEESQNKGPGSNRSAVGDKGPAAR